MDFEKLVSLDKKEQKKVDKNFKKRELKDKRIASFEGLIERNNNVSTEIREFDKAIESSDIVLSSFSSEPEVRYIGRIITDQSRLVILRTKSVKDGGPTIDDVSCYSSGEIETITERCSRGVKFSPVAGFRKALEHSVFSIRLDEVHETLEFFKQAAMDPELNPELSTKLQTQPQEIRAA